MSQPDESKNDAGIRERLHRAFGRLAAFAVLAVAVNVGATLILRSQIGTDKSSEEVSAMADGFLVLAALSCCWVAYIGRSLARTESDALAEPIDRPAEAVESLSRRKGSDDLPVPEGRELADLTRGFNRMRRIIGKAHETVSANMAAFQRTNLLLQRSNQKLENFAYVASHDLRSQLSAIDQLSGFVLEDCEEILP